MRFLRFKSFQKNFFIAAFSLSNVTWAIPLCGDQKANSYKPSLTSNEHARIITRKIPAPRGTLLGKNYSEKLSPEEKLQSTLAFNRVSFFPSINFPLGPYELESPEKEQHLINLIEERKTRLLQVIGEEKRYYLRAIDSENPLENKKKIIDYYQKRRWVPFLLSYVLSEQEKNDLAQFDGDFSFLPIYQREYPHGELASHLIGRLRRLKGTSIPRGDLSFDEYVTYPYEGISGVEKLLNTPLYGKEGVLYQLFDSEQSSEGTYLLENCISKEAVMGRSFQTTIDLQLQKYFETALKGRNASFLLSSIQTGEILSFVSLPNYKASDFLPWIGEKYNELLKNPNKPLLNRVTHQWIQDQENFNFFECSSEEAQRFLEKSFSIENKGVLLRHRQDSKNSEKKLFQVTPLQILKLAQNIWSPGKLPFLRLFPFESHFSDKFRADLTESCSLRLDLLKENVGSSRLSYFIGKGISIGNAKDLSNPVSFSLGAFPSNAPEYNFVLSIDSHVGRGPVSEKDMASLMNQLLNNKFLSEKLFNLNN